MTATKKPVGLRLAFDWLWLGEDLAQVHKAAQLF